MPKSFLIKRVQKVKTGFFPWNTETLLQGCCVEYEEDSDGNLSHDDDSISEIRLLTPWNTTSPSPPRLILTSACYDEKKIESSVINSEHRDEDIIIPSPLGNNYHYHDDQKSPTSAAVSSYANPPIVYPLENLKPHSLTYPERRYMSPWYVGSSENRKKHQCEYCLKWFDRSSSLSNHRLIHRNSKTFKCTECNMSFLRKSDLGKHMVTHSGCKPYQCNVCGKRFSQSSNMLTHQRRHTGIRPYSCGICGKSFYRKVDVRRHASVHKDY